MNTRQLRKQQELEEIRLLSIPENSNPDDWVIAITPGYFSVIEDNIGMATTDYAEDRIFMMNKITKERFEIEM